MLGRLSGRTEQSQLAGKSARKGGDKRERERTHVMKADRHTNLSI